MYLEVTDGRLGLALTLIAVIAMATVSRGDDGASNSIDTQAQSSWNGPSEDRLNLCGSDPVSVATCALCPSVLGNAVNAWKCCHDPTSFKACVLSVANAIEGQEEERLQQLVEEDDNDIDQEKRAKYFLGKRAKYFLGKRSFGNRGGYYGLSPAFRHQMPSQQYGLGGYEKRAKYFLGK